LIELGASPVLTIRLRPGRTGGCGMAPRQQGLRVRAA
jgi:hypothetical protein